MNEEMKADNARLRAENDRLPKLDRIFIAAQNWYVTVRGHLKYDSCGNCIDFGGMKPEAAELVRALDLYHVWRSLSPAAPVEQEKPCEFCHGKGYIADSASPHFIRCGYCQPAPEAHAE